MNEFRLPPETIAVLENVEKNINKAVNSPSFRSIIQVLSDKAKGFNELVNSPKFKEGIINATIKINKLLEQILPDLRIFVLKGNYFYVSDENFTEHLNRQCSKTLQPDILLEKLEDFYSQDLYRELSRLCTEWASYSLVKERIPILNTCQQILVNGSLSDENKAIAIIPLLLSQADGLMKELIVYFNPAKEKRKDQIKIHEELNKSLFDNLAFNQWYPITQIIHYLFYFKDGIYDTVNGKKVYKIKPAKGQQLVNHTLDRNGILHGSNLDYGQKIELIRLILAFDCLLKSIHSLVPDNPSTNDSVA
jgi:hypothetical protein